MRAVTDSDLIPATRSDVMPVTIGAERRWRSYGAGSHRDGSTGIRFRLHFLPSPYLYMEQPVPQMENAQREAGQELAVLPRFGWDASYWSKEMCRIFGLDPAPTPPSYMEVVRRLHPEDARYNTPVVEQAIRDRTDFETDFRILLPNGPAKYIHVVGHPVVNASGDVIELVGTAMDVTEEHEARAALQSAFEKRRREGRTDSTGLHRSRLPGCWHERIANPRPLEI
jgi:PAS domain-containing protein